MLGSYSADPNPRSTEVISDDFPSGMVARGTYTVISKVVDLDGKEWLGASICYLPESPQNNG
jgi:RHO protein GDP dissociation inhibitor